jgi:hypothetical protein
MQFWQLSVKIRRSGRAVDRLIRASQIGIPIIPGEGFALDWCHHPIHQYLISGTLLRNYHPRIDFLVSYRSDESDHSSSRRRLRTHSGSTSTSGPSTGDDGHHTNRGYSSAQRHSESSGIRDCRAVAARRVNHASTTSSGRSIPITLVRLVWPLSTTTDDLPTPRDSANKSTSLSFARLSTAGAAT